MDRGRRARAGRGTRCREPAVHAAGAHPDASSFPAWLRRRQLSQDADEHLDWAIADRETDHVLGNLTVFRLDPVANRFQAEIGYWLHPTARGKGVVPEVMPAIIDHAFAPVSEGGMGLARLYAATDLDNVASQAVLLRAGFRRWGQDRHAFRNADGDVTDGAYFELLSTDERVDRRPRRIDEVTLDGTRVRLRPWRDDDAERVVEGCTDDRAKQWLRACRTPTRSTRPPHTSGDVVGEAAVGTGLFLAMANPDDDACVGSIALMDLAGPDPTSGEVGYWAHPAARGTGVTTEAVGLLVRHAFTLSPREVSGCGGWPSRPRPATEPLSTSPRRTDSAGPDWNDRPSGSATAPTTTSSTTGSRRTTRGSEPRARPATHLAEASVRCAAATSRRSCAHDIRCRITRPVHASRRRDQPAGRPHRHRRRHDRARLH